MQYNSTCNTLKHYITVSYKLHQTTKDGAISASTATSFMSVLVAAVVARLSSQAEGRFVIQVCKPLPLWDGGGRSDNSFWMLAKDVKIEARATADGSLDHFISNFKW